MEVIFKAAGAGKSVEAMKLATLCGGNVLFVSNEMTMNGMLSTYAHVMSEHMDEAEDHDIFFIEATSEVDAIDQMADIQDALELKGQDVDLIVLDVNFGVTHSEWFHLAKDLEDQGYSVVVTQQLVRGFHNSKTTPVVKITK